MPRSHRVTHFKILRTAFAALHFGRYWHVSSDGHVRFHGSYGELKPTWRRLCLRRFHDPEGLFCGGVRRDLGNKAGAALES